MLSDAPNASWHPALMPNSISELPRNPPKELPAAPTHHDAAADDPKYLQVDEAAEEVHNQSIGAEASFPDYGSGDGWIDDASTAPPAAEASCQPETTDDATTNGTPDDVNTANKHFSTMSFARTVSNEVDWNDDDDPEWNLSRTSTDPFKFMPPSDRTNSFPAVPPQQHAPENELEHPLSPDQTEAVLHEIEEDENHESLGGFNADPEAFGAHFQEENLDAGDDFFSRAAEGNLNGLTDEALEARFEEGMPLIPSATADAPEPPATNGASDLFGEADAAEEDDFFRQVRGSESAEPEVSPHLERKSTFQVLDSLDVGGIKPGFTPLEETAEEEAETAEETQQDAPAPEEPAVTETQGEVAEDLDAKWKAILGDEEDGLLPDDIDPVEFLGSDDEGLLDESELPLETESRELPVVPQVATTPGTMPASSRYLPPTQAPGTATPAANPYFPAAPVSVPQPPAPVPYMMTASAPPAPARYGPAVPPPAQAQNKPQSFVDKAKGGYTSPYDLPMEVVKPKLRAPTHHNMQRSSSTPNVPPGPPAPPRSTSMNSPTGPPPVGAFGSTITPPGSSHGQPLPTAHKPGPPHAKAQEKFFEELPIATKPRPASRHSSTSVPSPPQASPYAPPPQAGPPFMASQTAPPQMHPHAPPPHPQVAPQAPHAPSFPEADLPKLVAPPRVSPYAPLQANTGLGPSVPPAASRYSPAAQAVPPNGAAAAGSRYSPAPPVRQASGGYGPPHSASAPSILPHQPRTSSPLAHFEITHERSRGHSANHHVESSLAEKRSTSSLYTASLQRVPSLPPTTEVEEEEGQAPAQTLAGQTLTPPSTSPELRYSQLAHRPRQTPPPSNFHGQSTLSPPKRATSSHGIVPASQDFAPPPRSHTQSPGKLYGNRNGKPTEPIPRPSSVHDPTSPRSTSAYLPAIIQPAHTAAPALVSPARARGFSQNFNLVAPTDGREKDPLQRWRGVPLISWGVGGTIVTMFPKDVPRYGINQSVPMVVRSPGEVKVQSAKDIQPLEERLMKFPGPLKGKSKKKETIAWLTAGIESLERAQPQNFYAQLHLSHDDKRVAERVLLWKILRLFIEHDGVLEGNPTVEKVVREILSPNLDSAEGAPVYITGADASKLGESPVTRMQSEAVNSSTVEQIRKHLLNGDSEKAIWAAADVRLWGHALLLANALAPNLYKQVSQEFIKKEVNFPGHNNESLAALYGVLSGNHEESVDELVPVHARAGLQLVTKDTASGTSKDAMEGLDKWRETLSLILSNRSPGDAQSINSLGNLLSGYGRAEAAHICYMFARYQTVFGGLDDPNSNFVLVGSDHKRQAEQFAKEIEPLLLSEVYEYGQSLAGGSNVAVSSPHLAAYKLQHAYALAEYGYRDKALQYCDAISAAITAQTKRSPYHHALLEAAVEDLAKRLKQAPKEESNSWIPKPSMNKVSDSVWNRFNKFVAGDDNDESGQGSPKEGETSGPFGRIAGGTPTISRPPSTNNLETFGATIPSYGVPAPITNGPVAASVPQTRAASRYAPAPAHAAAPGTSPYEPSSSYAPRSSMERTSSELTRTSSDLPRPSSDLQRGFNPYTPNQQPATPPRSYAPYGATPSHAQEQPSPAAQYHPTQTQPPMPATSSGYEPYGNSPAPVNGSDYGLISQSVGHDTPGYQAHGGPYGYGTPPGPVSKPSFTPRQENGVADAHAENSYSNSYEPPSQSYEPPSNSYEPPSSNSYEPPSNSYEPPSNSYEPPSYQPYGFEPPSYEPESQPSNEDGDSGEESKPKPKKKGIMYDDDEDDIPMPAVKPAEKSKEEKDRENAEMFRKAAEEDAKRAAEAKAAKKGWGFGSWFGGGAAKKETPDASNPNKPIRAKLGEANSFYYDPELKRWINKNGDPKDNEAKKATPPPPKGMPRSVSSSPAPPMAAHLPPTSHPDSGRASAPPAGPPRSTMTPPPMPSMPPGSDTNPAGPPSLGPPAMMRSVSNTSTASAPSRPTTSLSNSSSIDDLLSAAGPRKGAKKPRKSARYVDVMTK